jgi:hypothetical protein
MNILTTNSSHTIQRFAPAKMLVMIGVHGGITLVLRADLHTLTARHISDHGRTSAGTVPAPFGSWVGGMPPVAGADQHSMDSHGVREEVWELARLMAMVNLKGVDASWDGGEPCLHGCEPHRHLAVSTA